MSRASKGDEGSPNRISEDLFEQMISVQTAVSQLKSVRQMNTRGRLTFLILHLGPVRAKVVPQDLHIPDVDELPERARGDPRGALCQMRLRPYTTAVPYPTMPRVSTSRPSETWPGQTETQVCS